MYSLHTPFILALTKTSIVADLLEVDAHEQTSEENALVVIISDSNVPSDKPSFSTNRFLIISNGESVFTTKSSNLVIN